MKKNLKSPNQLHCSVVQREQFRCLACLVTKNCCDFLTVSEILFYLFLLASQIKCNMKSCINSCDLAVLPSCNLFFEVFSHVIATTRLQCIFFLCLLLFVWCQRMLMTLFYICCSLKFEGYIIMYSVMPHLRFSRCNSDLIRL